MSIIHFLEWKSLYFDGYFTETYSEGSIQPHTSIVLDNGLAQNRPPQAIIWTNVGMV